MGYGKRMPQKDFTSRQRNNFLRNKLIFLYLKFSQKIISFFISKQFWSSEKGFIFAPASGDKESLLGAKNRIQVH